MRKIVLIISEPGDYHAEAVSTLLRKKHDVNPVYINLNSFPQHAKGTFRASNSSKSSFCYDYEGSIIDFADIKSVWYRRPLPCEPPTHANAFERQFLQAENDHFIQGALWSLDCLWVNEPSKNRIASRKLTQLIRAADYGLLIPETIVTNDPNEALHFIETIPGKVIYKRTGTSPGPLSRTSFVSADVVENIQSISISPTTFQRYIEPKGDVRVTYIDGDMWAVFIDSTHSECQEDSRFDHTVDYRAHSLPSETEERLRDLINSFGLVYAAVDFRVDIEGNYYFLEINPAGQFAYLQFKTDIPLMERLATVLAKGKSDLAKSNDKV